VIWAPRSAPRGAVLIAHGCQRLFSPPNRPSRGSGSLTVYLADELVVYFNEVAHGHPVGFVASPKWKPHTDVYETDGERPRQRRLPGLTTKVEMGHDGWLNLEVRHVNPHLWRFDQRRRTIHRGFSPARQMPA
jgi:hypothetical protein